MNKHSDSTVLQNFAAGKHHLVSLAMLPLALIAAGMLAGCQTQFVLPRMRSKSMLRKTSELINLREGDVLKISFPGSPTLDTTQQIRRDGRVTMPLVGMWTRQG